MSITSVWNPKQKRLKEIIRKPDCWQDTKKLLFDMHASVHSSQMSGQAAPTVLDQLWGKLQKNDFLIMPTEKDVTIAWDLWHITRIEDLTMNFLVGECDQILNDAWLSDLHIQVKDTGNAMNDDEIMELSKQIDVDALKNYRIAVGRRTQAILASLHASDMKRKIDPQQLPIILKEGGVLEHPDSIWLLDFWGKKDVAGILLMPLTRHQIMHISDAVHIYEAIQKKKIFFRS